MKLLHKIIQPSLKSIYWFIITVFAPNKLHKSCLDNEKNKSNPTFIDCSSHSIQSPEEDFSYHHIQELHHLDVTGRGSH